MEITIPVAMLMSAGSTLAGISGTWAVLKYKLDRVSAATEAAHARLDEQSRKHNQFERDLAVLDERQKSQGAQVKALGDQIITRLDRLETKLDEQILGRA